jgi:hypothetical protein
VGAKQPRKTIPMMPILRHINAIKKGNRKYYISRNILFLFYFWRFDGNGNVVIFYFWRIKGKEIAGYTGILVGFGYLVNDVLLNHIMTLRHCCILYRIIGERRTGSIAASS